MKKIFNAVVIVAVLFAAQRTIACTNYLITRGASLDGSTMISYAADSHLLYGELYHWPARTWPAGSMLDVYEWDTGKFLGQIEQAESTFNVVGNMNEHQLSIGETTFGGLEQLETQSGAIIDYGSLIYITLQRAKNAREAIKVMHQLVSKYGYYSSGESFSIADPDEVWLMELIGKGEGEKGAVWVARRIPDGYVSGHANQARITTFPLENMKISISTKDINRIFDEDIECVYSEDVISFARRKGLYRGGDQEFSFSDVYAPVSFGGARFCEMRSLDHVQPGGGWNGPALGLCKRAGQTDPVACRRAAGDAGQLRIESYATMDQARSKNQRSGHVHVHARPSGGD